MSTNESTIDDFRKYVKKMRDYEEAVNLINWDLRTGAPKKGVPQRSEVLGTLATEMFRMSVSEQMATYLEALSGEDVLPELDLITRKTVEECKKNYDRSKSIPPEKFQAYVVLVSNSESAWETARENDDFSSFQPYLEKIVSYQKEFIEIWGYEGNKYNTLLDMYEPGLTVEKLDVIFADLRSQTIDLLRAIQQSGTHIETSFLTKYYDPAKQKEFSKYILKQMGYDFDAGRLDETAHPFANGLNPGDVRVTTRYNAYDFRSAIFGTIHEGGHGLYEQNVSTELIGTPLSTGTSMGIHESQSRFWENMVGRSFGFWERYYKDLVKVFPESLENVALDQFYRGVNLVEPSLIRVEADELTYNLHIMIRYEIEKALINGELEVADLPRVWAEKYEEYLGITPPNDADGVLQDVHWSGGMFGYFPSYSLGNIYAAQFEHVIRKEIANYEALIREGNLKPIKDWLVEKIHRHGKLLTPAEILKQVTGEEINSKYLVAYLQTKFGAIYGLK